MDYVKQFLDQIEHNHRNEIETLKIRYEERLTTLQASHEKEVQEQARNFGAKILALRTENGLEREHRIQQAVFKHDVFSGLCSMVIANYNPNKYPPNMHTLLTALADQDDHNGEESNKEGDSTLTTTGDATKVKQEEECEDVMGGRTKVEEHEKRHKVSYHRVAAFRDAILDGLQHIGAGITGDRPLPTPSYKQNAELEFEKEQLQLDVADLEEDLEACQDKVANLQQEVHFVGRKAQRHHQMFVQTVLDANPELDPRRCDKNEYLAKLEAKKYSRLVIKALKESEDFARLWEIYRKRKSPEESKPMKRCKVEDMENTLG